MLQFEGALRIMSKYRIWICGGGCYGWSGERCGWTRHTGFSTEHRLIVLYVVLTFFFSRPHPHRHFTEAPEMVIAESLSEEEIAGLKQMFQMIDADNSDEITFEELKVGLKRVGANLKESEIYDLMQAVSPN
ncbi:putative non-specific serine/threonine protein kinase [Helianthus annuus]|nr:putative non-specific serine/threonine protein kinase [Helianthus annuus]KAJ0721170.1 putative non-specific serine/threonine protein kinase [Helianthus annuus]